eukprot:TRINITY_DN7958_c0_g1_i1.p1 TRINITY_DN7958_c0_g1~~TRINITY_DN7958_c0_g1_i1.p1  ORF type:complete len:258 (+),score=63.49 TRINITY_DN7958_c0_g1_i1:36-776(+)
MQWISRVVSSFSPNAQPVESPTQTVVSLPRDTVRIDQGRDYFHRYSKPIDDTGSQEIGPDEIEQFCSDLGLAPTDARILVFSWKCQAKRMGYYTEEEFLRGLGASSTAESHLEPVSTSPETLRSILDTIWSQLTQSTSTYRCFFTDLYKYSFTFSLETQLSKTLQADIASELILLLLGDIQPSKGHLHDLAGYIKKRGVSVNRDQWMLVIEFCDTIQEDYSNYDETSSWPPLFDEFVEEMKQSNAK